MSISLAYLALMVRIAWMGGKQIVSPKRLYAAENAYSNVFTILLL